jgi:hypothetical protein
LQRCQRGSPSRASRIASGCRSRCESSSTPTILCIPTSSERNWQLPFPGPHSPELLRRRNPKSCTGPIFPACSTILSSHLGNSLVAECLAARKDLKISLLRIAKREGVRISMLGSLVAGRVARGPSNGQGLTTSSWQPTCGFCVRRERSQHRKTGQDNYEV